MNKNEFEQKLARIPVVEPDAEDRAAIQRICQNESKNLEDDAISLDELLGEIEQEKMEYSGKISLRLPKSLHRELAEQAKREGVSLNQYALYKLSK